MKTAPPFFLFMAVPPCGDRMWGALTGPLSIGVMATYISAHGVRDAAFFVTLAAGVWFPILRGPVKWRRAERCSVLIIGVFLGGLVGWLRDVFWLPVTMGTYRDSGNDYSRRLSRGSRSEYHHYISSTFRLKVRNHD